MVFDTEIQSEIKKAKKEGRTGRIYLEARVYGTDRVFLNEYFVDPSVSAGPEPNLQGIFEFFEKNDSIRIWLKHVLGSIACISCGTQTDQWVETPRTVYRPVGYWHVLGSDLPGTGDLIGVRSIEGPSAASQSLPKETPPLADVEAPFEKVMRATFSKMIYPTCCNTDQSSPCHRKIMEIMEVDKKKLLKQMGKKMSAAIICPSCYKEAPREKANLDFKRCSRCKVTFYCSIECQKAHWSSHRNICNDRLGGAEFEEIRKKLAEQTMD
jgi:hypothetical protein